MTALPTRPRHAPAHPWAVDAGIVARDLGTDTARGLGADEAARRLAAWGRNEIVEQRPPSRVALLAHQFANTMTVVLLAAGAVTVLIGDGTDAFVIALIIVLNVVVGYVQEHRAEQAVAALKQLTTDNAEVVRDGRTGGVAVPELVPGDIVRLTAGDVVPADIRLVDVHGLRVDEATLTGESEPSHKSAAAIPQDGPVLVADQHNMAFKGTAVAYGRAVGIVVGTGMATELGQIAALLQAHDAGPTPLQRRLAALGRVLAAGALAVCVVVFVAGIATGEAVEEMFLTSVSLAVAAVPEGLPAVVTVALALGARRMATRRALVRRLPAVETLGSVAVICSDKTGTLTENRMLVERVWTPAGRYTVTGDGYAPEGRIDGRDAPPDDPFLTPLARVAAACNDATLHAPAPGRRGWTISGDPTEGALLALAAKLGVERPDLEQERPRLAELAFDAARRRMTTAHASDGGCWVATKGALAALAPLVDERDADALSRARRAADDFADEGYRVLALAERDRPSLPEHLDDLERGLRLVGLVAIADPPRAEARDAIATCRAAGMTPVMITGDHPRTARAIARRLGLLDDGHGDRALLTGEELDGLSDDTLVRTVPAIRVYARTTPEQKLRIVSAWKACGAVVAMTGDGVNDAPALRRADIGVAMGENGTDVSREAADMVLADDNFATIVSAVEEGRRIYDNVRRFVRYMLTTNSGELLVMIIAPLLGLPFPLVPAQILWINLVTDGPPAIALGVEPAEPDTMLRPPRPPAESILGRGLWQQAVWVGLLIAATTIGVEAAARAAGWPWQSMVFTTLSLLSLGNALAVRSERHSAHTVGMRSNPWMAVAIAFSLVAQLATIYVPALHDTFHTTTLTAAQLAVTIAASTTAFLAVEADKWIHRRIEARGDHGR